jgi:CheY-like chemotaxis protein
MPKKILIVDDSPTSRVMHRYLITSNTNYEVLCATDGLNALDLAKSERPDLVLMDVMMPQVDGLEVCRRLRKDSQTHALPVILLTFKNEEDSAAIGRESGANEYLTKPVDQAILLRTLKRYLD